MTKPPLLMLIPVVIFAGFAGLFLAGMFREAPGEVPSTMIGHVAPALTEEVVPDTDLLVMDDFATGEVTILNFWASWCPPCRAEHPTLLRLNQEGYRIAGLNFRDTADQAAAYLKEYGNPFFATGFDHRGRVALDWGVAAPPETFIIGPDGIVLFRFIGPLVGDDFEQRFMPMLEDALVQTGS